MILQALTQYYETLATHGNIFPEGWGPVRVSYAIELNDSGEPERVFDIRTEQKRRNKNVCIPQELTLPAPVKRASGVAANFLWDHSGYLLGVDSKGKPKRAKECFDACRRLHEGVLNEVSTPAAKALLRFFETWQPENAPLCSAFSEYYDELISGSNIVFPYKGSYIHDDSAICAAWDNHYALPEEGDEMVCLVTGKKSVPARLHPSIKGIYNGQSMGNSLICFNDRADESYGCVNAQGRNAPVSKYAAFAYTAALNQLLSERDHVHHIGDTTVVCWARNGESSYQQLFGNTLFGDEAPAYTALELTAILKSLLQGNPVYYNEKLLDPQMDFYVLGLSPNAARLSVRFFFQNTFGDFLRNVQEHYQRLAITRPLYDHDEALPLWKLLGETVNQNARDKSVSPKLAGEMLMAVLQNTRYPATLLNGVALRIRADRDISRGRAAIIKAYYMKNAHADVPKEVLKMSLNPESTNVPYTLGRLFSVLEAIQLAPNPNINTTIKDKFFNAASATPAVVFPTLINLAQKHLRKLPDGQRIFFSKQMTELMDKLHEAFPTNMNLPQQGAFQLGYYHQTQTRYQKKEDK